MDLFSTLVDAEIDFGGGQHVLWREVVGNAFGLASAVGGMRRRVWAWPVGIVGNVLLFTVFLGAVFGTPQGANLLGQAGRQVMFAAVAVYGWHRWRTRPGTAHGAAAVVPRWATWRERLGMLAVAVVMIAVLTPTFRALGSFEPAWTDPVALAVLRVASPDAFIFTGSLLATYGMARGWNDFWLIWVAVDLVGVPLLLAARLYPSAVLYLVYGVFVLYGLTVWLRAQRREQRADGAASPAVEAVG